MNPFYSLLSKKNSNLSFPNSQLINILKELNNDKLFIFQNLTIYHRDTSIYIPLLILDIDHGIFLFEHKEWSYQYLKNSTINKSANQHPDKNNLYFTKIQKFIIQKFDAITNTQEIKIFNFLLVENLTTEQYDDLDESFKELLPKERLFFKDSSEADIIGKMKTMPHINIEPQKVNELMADLLVQYLILGDNKQFLATPEQRAFIDSSLKGHQILKAPSLSGKSSCLLLKAIFFQLKNLKFKSVIVVPSSIACDLLREQLLNTVEHSIVNVDITLIEVLTPIELLNKHLKKLKKELLEETIYIENALMDTKFNIANIIMCDDSDLLPREFISYLIHIQKNSDLLLVTSLELFTQEHIFQKSFRTDEQSFIFEKTEQYPKTLQIIQELLQNNTPQDILIISKSLSTKDFHDDLIFYIHGKSSLFNDSTNLITNDLKNLTLASYHHLSSTRYKFVILLDIAQASIAELVYASNLSKKSVYYLYEEECEEINILRNKFETKTK